MSGESPKASSMRPPPWPKQPSVEDIERPPIIADPAPPWGCWFYDPAPPWIEFLERDELGAVLQAKLRYERARLVATNEYLDSLQAVLEPRKRKR